MSEPRIVFVRDSDKTVSGLSSYERAQEIAKGIPETATQRVRVRFRNRTSTWDVVVKTAREQKDSRIGSTAADPQLRGENLEG